MISSFFLNNSVTSEVPSIEYEICIHLKETIISCKTWYHG